MFTVLSSQSSPNGFRLNPKENKNPVFIIVLGLKTKDVRSSEVRFAFSADFGFNFSRKVLPGGNP